MNTPGSSSSLGLEGLYLKADRTMLGVLWITLLFSFALAAWHQTWMQALLVGGGTLAVMHGLHALVRGQRLFRCMVAVALMVMSALHINQSRGAVEMHFSIFVLPAFLIYYRDWLPIVIGAGSSRYIIWRSSTCKARQRGSGWLRRRPGGWCGFMPVTLWSRLRC